MKLSMHICFYNRKFFHLGEFYDDDQKTSGNYHNQSFNAWQIFPNVVMLTKNVVVKYNYQYFTRSDT